MATLSRTLTRELDHQLWIRLRENLLDLDVVVDDCRAEVTLALDRLAEATAARDAAAVKLAQFLAAAA